MVDVTTLACLDNGHRTRAKGMGDPLVPGPGARLECIVLGGHCTIDQVNLIGQMVALGHLAHAIYSARSSVPCPFSIALACMLTFCPSVAMNLAFHQ